jgi:transaldolase
MKNSAIFLDTGDLELIKKFSKKKIIAGYTTNPTLLKKINNKKFINFLKNYNKTSNKPISVEVTKKNIKKLYTQALRISSYNKNIFVKIPYYDYKGKNLLKVIKNLIINNIKLNITAIFTKKQINSISKILKISNAKKQNVIVSIFCGRIADTMVDPKSIFKYAVKKLTKKSNLLWASTREIFNLIEAKKCNADIITITYELLKKIRFKYYNLEKFSKETCKDFFDDGRNLKL